ncbi:MAG: hypothetical protein AB1500_02810 [Bacillota bacterium]
MESKSLSQLLPLGGATDRQTLAAACRELADSLAAELKSKGLVYQEVSLAADTEDGAVKTAGRFTRSQVPVNLRLHLNRMASRLRIHAPVESLTVTVAGLARASVEQLNLFDGRDPLREERVHRVLDEINRSHALTSASSFETDRRERMLTFYDPYRQEEKAVEVTGRKAQGK